MRQLIVVPVFNEADTVAEVAAEIRAQLSPTLEQVIFIDDFSTDGSAEILDEVTEGDLRMSVIHREENYGYGSAMIDALMLGLDGHFDHVITMDCDRQHRPLDLQRFSQFDPAVPIVSGSRYLDASLASGIEPPADRVEVNRRVTRLINARYGWQLTDAFCGFKRYRCSDMKPHVLTERGYAFPMEFWAYAFSEGLTVEELPVGRIYVTNDRSFGEDLDDRLRRFRYYLRTWRRAEQRLAALAV